MVKFIWQHNSPVGSYHTFKMPPGRLDFWCSKGKKWDPPVTPKLKLREVSQSGFWNISLYPTSVPSFSQIGWPQLLAPGTLSQTMTLKLTTDIFMCKIILEVEYFIKSMIYQMLIFFQKNSLFHPEMILRPLFSFRDTKNKGLTFCNKRS